MVTRLSGGLTPADGADPRTFPAIWNDTADVVEAQGTAVTGLQSDVTANGTAIAGLEADSIPTDVSSPVSGDSLVYDGSNWVNGPRSGNAIINGDFGVWQRGTSFSGPSAGYTADRWNDESSGGTLSITREAFSPGDIEAIGYGDAEYFLRTSRSGGNFVRLVQRIEDVRTFAGQQVTLSFWARVGSGTATNTIRLNQEFGSGGSSSVSGTFPDITLTTDWQRFVQTITLSSVAGKTIGSGSHLDLQVIRQIDAVGHDIDLWGVQLEAGPVATPFRLAGGGSKAAELALCQRYYYKVTTDAAFRYIGTGFYESSSSMLIYHHFPVTMRIVPTLEATSGTNYYRLRPADYVDSISSTGTTLNAGGFFNNTQASGTPGNAGRFTTESSSASVAWRAEL